MALLSAKRSLLPEEWLKKRLPWARSTTLDRKRIFIIPSKTALALMVMVLILFILGVNFQNTLVYAVCAWLVAMILINILHTYQNLAGLTITAVQLEPCFAGEKAVLQLSLACPNKQQKLAVQLEWRDEDAVQVNVLSQSPQTVFISHSAQQRGYFTPPRLRVSTRYPTGLAIAWSLVAFDVKGLVYPKPLAHSYSGLTKPSGEVSEDGRDIAQGTSDFAGIRSYRDGDALSQLHWKKYAQTGQLHSKTFVDPTSDERWVDWDNTPFSDTEQRLSYLCTRVLELHQLDYSYGLRLPQITISPDKGEAHKLHCLRALALYGLSDA
ncbi:DUF58 domain-containing protein [Thiolinea disciformis]|uniref:DUF58 domain-containing protein n=1 Tax=Thiolinea disciformis TaxID=125614 RepID=UPI0003814E8C|nr:DUF58 domain-containing protein [Thiolinea disciformis]